MQRLNFTPPNIRQLLPNQIFVFGSNLAGAHGKGAALDAWRRFGAENGVGVGPTGRCYALPTKDENILTLPIDDIDLYINEFISYAEQHPESTFLVTEIGCGLAGYKTHEIGQLFAAHGLLSKNIILPESFVYSIIYKQE